MSTILNTLKKLEEEKSVLEKNIDLKGLLLQGQDSAYPQVERQAPKKWGILGGLMAGAVLLGVVVYFFYLSKPEATQPENFTLPTKPQVAQEKKRHLKPAASNPGIPLAGIPETEPAAMDDPWKDEDFFGPEDALPPEALLPMEEIPRTAAVEAPALEGSEEIREIENLIQSATSSSELEKQNLEEPVSRLSGLRHVPGVKLKGIIFFGSGNPANHVFVATDAEKNRKLKVGDTVLNATLESIEAKKAVFSYGGQWVETLIGD
ncbi:MAG: hypothetical protein NPINA01_19190 [Nitrospinaceae bacterium]|nr:MAG: hypothetical protein NPINA01_19190 [Nitrospinaceae bacterium]